MTEEARETEPRSQIRTLLAAVFIAFLAQMSLNPIIAPLAREVGLKEWQIGVTISSAAVMVVISSPVWGRKSQSWGRKRVLMYALALATCAMVLFAVVSQLGMVGILQGGLLFGLFLALRGIGFGTAIAAVMPTAQAYISDITTDEKTRVRGMSGLGAAQGMSMVGGAFVGGVLGGFGLIVPLIAVPTLLALGLLLIAFRLRAQDRAELIENPTQISPFDGRVWPFLAAGFGMFTGLGFIQVIAGFIIQDRLDLDAEGTALVTGGMLVLTGVGIVISQAVIVPKTGWSPATLLRVGIPIAAVGFAVLVFDLGAVALTVGMVTVGVGMGIAMPGFSAGPTLLVSREEQGGLAGLLGATTGLTFVVAPALSAWLYGIWPSLPVIVGGAIMVAVAGFVFVHPKFRRLPNRPAATS